MEFYTPHGCCFCNEHGKDIQSCGRCKGDGVLSSNGKNVKCYMCSGAKAISNVCRVCFGTNRHKQAEPFCDVCFDEMVESLKVIMNITERTGYKCSKCKRFRMSPGKCSGCSTSSSCIIL